MGRNPCVLPRVYRKLLTRFKGDSFVFSYLCKRDIKAKSYMVEFSTMWLFFYLFNRFKKMSWFKELWQLITMLFTSRPSDTIAYGLKEIRMKHFPFGSNDFMMWCGNIIIKEDGKDDNVTVIVYNHEKIHCYQACYVCDDNWIKYYLSYFWHWLKHFPLIDSRGCYFANRYEIEAYANEEDFYYCDEYIPYNTICRYNIPHAKRRWGRFSRSRNRWIDYIKTL